jgi:glucuronoarabinoxylan endo-1,4-beta-xylanase
MCVPALEPSSNVTIDDSRQFQTLVGVGAGVAYINDEIAMHSQKQALFDAMFSGSGLTMLRLRNRLGDDGADLTSTREIVAAATERQGQAPSILLNSASPPPSLKANDSVWCEGNPDTCTLATLADGSFDYDGFASHWRAILDLYAAEGIMPDYISIQNNPNWVPGVGAANEACRFLPTEGSEEVTTSEATLTVDYPGYVEALDAVVAALDGLASVPQVVAPETTGISSAIEYAAALDFAQVDAIAHHLYSAASLVPVDTEVRTALAELADQQQLPVFQTEMAEDALTTAILMHSSFVVENAAVFIHNGFVGSANSLDDGRVLIHLNEDAFVVGDLYHVMLHYSAHIEPGWVRVAADSDNEDVLASAWRSPEGDATVIVLTNPGITEQVVHVDVRSDASDSIVTRTVLPGVERSANLGALSVDGTVRLPGQSIATVALQR